MAFLTAPGIATEARRRSSDVHHDVGEVVLQSGLPLLRNVNGPMIPVSTRSRRRHLSLKRGMDCALALGAILVFLPLLVWTALAVKLTSPGPILFKQSRPGLGGRPFLLIKFRTIYADLGDSTGIRQVKAGDERVTGLGKFLRKTSLDELPQLFNVLRGDMSLVGPRPHVEGMLAAGKDYRELVPHYALRYLVRPGLSGWAQANGLRGPTDDAELSRARIDHDIAYIQHLSIWLDIRILVMTLRSEFFRGTGV